VKVAFINEFGASEAGIDGRGLFKDFITSLCKQAFDPEHGLFRATAEERLYPSPASELATSEHLQCFELLGAVLGKCLYDGILVELPLAPFFLRRIRGLGSGLRDLASMDADLYRNLTSLKTFDGDVEALSLFFVAEVYHLGAVQEVELVPGGRDIPVTRDNVLRYIHLVAHFKLNVQMRAQSAAFVRGLHSVIDAKWLEMFNDQELQELIAGATRAPSTCATCGNTSSTAAATRPTTPRCRCSGRCSAAWSQSTSGPC